MSQIIIWVLVALCVGFGAAACKWNKAPGEVALYCAPLVGYWVGTLAFGWGCAIKGGLNAERGRVGGALTLLMTACVTPCLVLVWAWSHRVSTWGLSSWPGRRFVSGLFTTDMAGLSLWKLTLGGYVLVAGLVLFQVARGCLEPARRS